MHTSFEKDIKVARLSSSSNDAPKQVTTSLSEYALHYAMLANNLIAFTIAAITASAAPLAPRQGYPQGYLHVVSKDLSYNQEAVIDSPTNQVVLGQPNSGFTLVSGEARALLTSPTAR